MTKCPVCKQPFEPEGLSFDWQTGWLWSKNGSVRMRRGWSDILEALLKSDHGLSIERLIVKYLGSVDNSKDPATVIRTNVCQMNKRLTTIGLAVRNVSGGRPAVYVLVEEP